MAAPAAWARLCVGRFQCGGRQASRRVCEGSCQCRGSYVRHPWGGRRDEVAVCVLGGVNSAV
eukprot:351251-Chlamydomonas_euryale.AAC.2